MEFGCYTPPSHYTNFDLNIISGVLSDQYNLEITGVKENNLGEYACSVGIPNSGTVLCLAVDADDIHVEFNETEYFKSSELTIPLSTLESQNYILNAIAKNSVPQTTFVWSINDGSGNVPMEATSHSNSSTTGGSCGPFNSNSSLTYDDFYQIEMDEFTIILTAMNEETGKVTTIELTVTILADTTTTLQSTNTTKSDGTSTTKNVGEQDKSTSIPLSLGTIIGIILGIVGLIFLIALIIYIIRVKLFSKTARAFTIDPKSSCV